MSAIRDKWYLAWLAIAPENVEKKPDFHQKQPVDGFYIRAKSACKAHSVQQVLANAICKNFAIDLSTSLGPFPCIAESVPFTCLDRVPRGLPSLRCIKWPLHVHRVSDICLSGTYWMSGSVLTVQVVLRLDTERVKWGVCHGLLFWGMFSWDDIYLGLKGMGQMTKGWANGLAAKHTYGEGKGGLLCSQIHSTNVASVLYS